MALHTHSDQIQMHIHTQDNEQQLNENKQVYGMARVQLDKIPND